MTPATSPRVVTRSSFAAERTSERVIRIELQMNNHFALLKL